MAQSNGSFCAGNYVESLPDAQPRGPYYDSQSQPSSVTELETAEYARANTVDLCTQETTADTQHAEIQAPPAALTPTVPAAQPETPAPTVPAAQHATPATTEPRSQTEIPADNAQAPTGQTQAQPVTPAPAIPAVAVPQQAGAPVSSQQTPPAAVSVPETPVQQTVVASPVNTPQEVIPAPSCSGESVDEVGESVSEAGQGSGNHQQPNPYWKRLA